MNEVEYVLKYFEKHFCSFIGKRIILHGSRNFAEAIIERYDSEFHFIGIMSQEPLPEPFFHGLRVFHENELQTIAVDLVILTERVKYAEAVYEDIHAVCEHRNIKLYDMYGLDEIEIHKELSKYKTWKLNDLKVLCSQYQVVVFETMSVLLNDVTLKLCKPFDQLIPWLCENGKDLRFSLRKSFPEDLQIEALKKELGYPDIESLVIRRRGEDLSFRSVRDFFPSARILNFGYGLVNECILPRYYGIDTCRIGNPEIGFAPIDNHEPEPIKYDRNFKSDIMDLIHEADIISFDIFDTLLIRKLLFPEDVFLLVEQKGREAGIPMDSFFEMRIKAQRMDPYADICKIYARLRKDFRWTAEMTEKILSIELEIERSVICARKEVVDIFNFAVDTGKKVILTSDMYLPSEILETILAENGIMGYSEIFVSCEYRKFKMNGLFGEVRKLSHGRIIHIGDSYEADHDPCISEHIRSVIIPSVKDLARTRGWGKCFDHTGTLAERCLLGMAFADLFRDPFQNPNLFELDVDERLCHYASGVIGPLVVGFLLWLIQKTENREYDAIMLTSRDGWIFYKLLERIKQRIKIPRPVYLYANRRAAFLSRPVVPESFRFLKSMDNFGNASMSEILSGIYALPEDQILPELPGESSEQYFLRHLPQLTVQTEKAQRGWQRYFEKNHLDSDGTFFYMDFIAKGTTQAIIQQFFTNEITGLYFANYRPEYVNSNITYYYHAEREVLLNNFIELESFITSPEPSVDHISEDGEVIFAEEIRSEEDLREVRLVLDLAEKFAVKFFDLFYQKNDMIDSGLIDEMFAADGCHWVQRFAWDDWSKSPIRTKPWQTEEDRHK